MMTNQNVAVVTARIEKTSYLIEKLKQVKEMKELGDKYQLNYDETTINMYPGTNGFAVVIPVEQADALLQKFVVAYYDEDHMVKNVKVMSLEYKDGESTFSFATSDETHKVSWNIENGELKPVVNLSEKLQGQGVTDVLDCISKGWDRAPLAVKIACGTACGGFFTGVGAAACLGCLAGFGITC